MRLVICRGVNTRMPFPDNRCTEVKPVTMERCLDRGPCFTDPLWRPKAWTAVSLEFISDDIIIMTSFIYM